MVDASVKLSPRETRRTRKRGAAKEAAAPSQRGLPFLAIVFLLTFLIPIGIQIGPLFMQPYRLTLTILLIPLALMLVTGRVGRVLAIDWLMLAAVLWAILSLFVHHPANLIIESAGVTLIEFFGGYLLGRICIRSADDLFKFAKLFFIVVAALLPFAAIEALTGRPVLLDFIPNSHINAEAGERLGLRRVQSLFAHPIHYGVFVSTALGLVWYCYGARASSIGRLFRTIVVALSTFFSLSTGALVSFVMQIGFITWEYLFKKNPKRWRVLIALVIAAYIIVDMISNRTPFHVFVTYATLNTGSAYGRIIIFQFGFENVLNNPIFGIGLNEWERPIWLGSSVDNFWLLHAMQFGLPSFFAFVTAVYLIIRRASKLNAPDRKTSAAQAGYLTAFGGAVIAATTVHYWHSMQALFLFMVGAGVWLTTMTSAERPFAETSAKSNRRRSTRTDGHSKNDQSLAEKPENAS